MLEYFPDPHPDELLYSVWARFSDLVKYSNRGDVSLELFGSKSARALVDWSCSLGYFIRQLPVDHLYTADILIDRYTLFPLYAPFLPLERRHHLRNQMIDGNGAALSARLGMLTSHIPHFEWLRFCPECVKSDRERFGETYWHRLHQAPGVVVCPVHTVYLEDSTVARQSSKRGFTSADSAVHRTSSRSADGSPLCGSLVDIAECVDQLLHRLYASPEPPFFKKQYLALLEQRGFLTLKGSLRVVEFLKALTEHYSPSLLSLLHCELNNTRHIEAEWPARLPLSPRSQHPLHHILVIRFLGATIDSFFSSRLHPPHPFGVGPWPCLNPVCTRYQTLNIASYSTREKSAKDRPVGLFSCPECGLTYSRAGPDRSHEDLFRRDRIPAYGQLWQMKLRELWLDPDISLERIAKRLGVDFNTVKLQAKRLQLTPRPVSGKGIARGQKDDIDGKKLEQRRKEWSRLMEEHAQEGITALLRRVKGARGTYNWLNKHDREWLLSHRPAKKAPQTTKEHMRATFRSMDEISDKSRREERDAITSCTLRVEAGQIANALEEPRKVTRARLEEVVPELGWLLSSPDNFPLTVQAFQEVRETRAAFALRRIQWTLQRYHEEAIEPTRKEFILRAKVKKVMDIPAVLQAIEEALEKLARNCRQRRR